MKTPFSLCRSVTLALCAAVVATQAPAAPLVLQEQAEPMIVAQADCYAIGQQIAAQSGGTLARASASSQGGRPVCVIVVLVPGKEGQRPRRREIVVPAG
jgi:ABC-type taurine transport system substrate-binding protein